MMVDIYTQNLVEAESKTHKCTNAYSPRSSADSIHKPWKSSSRDVPYLQHKPSYLLIIYRQSTHQHDGAAYLTEGLHHFTIPRFLLTKHLHVEVSDFHALPRVMAALTDTQEAAAAMMLATA